MHHVVYMSVADPLVLSDDKIIDKFCIPYTEVLDSFKIYEL